ncbi:MAG: autotransporter domain-containing protein, partial [Alphaproteobacteria bacterium]|nr:autotransporter domain-containing protein [Alphaproteobacteria bacterium]
YRSVLKRCLLAQLVGVFVLSTPALAADDLVTLNQSTDAERVYNFENASDVYTLTGAIGKTGAGKYTINGKVDGDVMSTVDMGAFGGFEVRNNINLSVNNVAFKDFTFDKSVNELGSLLYLNGSNSTVSLNNITFEGANVLANIYNGTIYIENGKVENLSGKFTNNKYEAKDYVIGSVVCNNKGNIGIIEGEFVGNESTALKRNISGGVIYTGTGSIGIISGKFENNKMSSTTTAYGGVIYNGTGKIEMISGKFENNNMLAGTTARGSALYVGSARIGIIEADFIGNSTKVVAGGSSGGTIAIGSTGLIDRIVGNFKGNSVYTQSGSGIGGALLNISSKGVGRVKGNFENNYAVSETLYAFGGAIANAITVGSGEIPSFGLLESSFIGNYAKSLSSDRLAIGGAVYNRSKMTFLADGKEIKFSGNYTEDYRGKINNAIFSRNDLISGGNVTYYVPEIILTAQAGGSIVFDDTIDGGTTGGDFLSIDRTTGTYTLNIEGDSSGHIYLNNEVLNANTTLTDVNLHLGVTDTANNVSNVFGEEHNILTANSGVIDTVDNNAVTHNINKLVSSDTGWKVDIDLTSQSGDSFKVADTGSNGEIKIKEFNFINPKDSYSGDVVVQLIKGADGDANSSPLQLNIATASNNLLSTTALYAPSVTTNDVLNQLDSTIRLATTDTLNDSIMLKFTSYNTLEYISDLVAQNNDKKSFIFTELNPTYEYSGNEESLEISGDLTIRGSSSDTNVLDMKDTSLEIKSDAVLTLSDASIQGSKAIVNDGVFNNQGSVSLIDNRGTVNLGSGSSFIDIIGGGQVNIASDYDLRDKSIIDSSLKVHSGEVLLSHTSIDRTSSLEVSDGAVVDIADNAVSVRRAVFSNGSSLKLTVNSLSEHGSFSAGNFAIANGATLNATLANGLVGNGESAEIQLLSSQDRDFNNFADVFSNNMYKFEKKDLNGAYIVTGIRKASDVSHDNGGTKTNQEAAGAYLDNGVVNNAVAKGLNDLAQQDGKALNRALTSLAPSDAPLAQSITSHQNEILFRTVAGQLRNRNLGKKLGRSSGDVDNITLWATPYISGSKLQRRGDAYGFNTDSKGIILGLENKLSSSVSVGGGYQFDDTDVDTFGRDLDVHTNTLYAYAQYKPNNWFSHITMSYNISDYDEKKFVMGKRYDADYKSNVYALQALTGYEFQYITPEAGLRHYHIKRHGYVDDAGQEVSGKNMDILRGVAGLRASKDFYLPNCRYIRPEAYLGATYDFVSDRDNAYVSLSNGSGYMVHGKRLNRFGIEAAAGVTVEVNDNLNVNTNYLGTYRKDYQDHTAMIGMQYKF